MNALRAAGHAQPITPHDDSTKYRQVITTFVVP